jgi:hypothetical protein
MENGQHSSIRIFNPHSHHIGIGMVIHTYSYAIHIRAFLLFVILLANGRSRMFAGKLFEKFWVKWDWKEANLPE